MERHYYRFHCFLNNDVGYFMGTICYFYYDKIRK
jgi:hypothetical protein